MREYVNKLMSMASMKRRVPGLRDAMPPSDCKVYKMIDGKKTLVRKEAAELNG